MFEPKEQPRSANVEPIKRCANTNCNQRLSAQKLRRGDEYCDKICKKEHERMLLQEQIHTQIACENCGKELDYASRSPSDWERAEHYFCNKICCHEWRKKGGFYKEASALGNASRREYKAKHGHAQQYETRSRATSENNVRAAPKAKWHDRQGKAWGYDVLFKGTGEDYIVSVPELPQIGEFHASTMKIGLLEVRARMLALHTRKGKLAGTVDVDSAS